MIYRDIMEIFSLIRMVGPLRGASYIAPCANVALLLVTEGGPAASSRLASQLDQHPLHSVELQFLGL